MTFILDDAWTYEFTSILFCQASCHNTSTDGRLEKLVSASLRMVNDWMEINRLYCKSNHKKVERHTLFYRSRDNEG